MLLTNLALDDLRSIMMVQLTRFPGCERERLGLASSAAFWIASPTVLSSPYVMLTVAAARLRTANALIRGGGMRSEGPPMSKFCTDLIREARSVSRFSSSKTMRVSPHLAAS